MRRINKKNSTKTERKFYEILKELKKPFKHRWIINGFEIDFLVGNYAIELDGHEQSGERNHTLANLGYIPLHINNSELYQNREHIKKIIKNL